MDFPKKQQQNLIPRYLLQYLTSLEYHHTDPTAEWGSSYTEGTGITIVDDVISVDSTVVALKTDLSDYVTNSVLSSSLANYVTRYTNQQITGDKTFSGSTVFTGATSYQGPYYNVYLYRSGEAGLVVTSSYDPDENYASIIYPGSIRVKGSSNDVTLEDTNLTAFNEYKVTLINGLRQTIGEYTFKNKTGDVAVTSEIPTATSDLTNDSGYITSSDLSNYVTSTDLAAELLNYAELDDLPTDTSDLTNGAGYITSSALSGYATETWVTNQGYSTFSGSYNDLTDTPSLATVATSGSYNDLTNKPTITSVSGTTSYYDALYWSTIKIGNTTANIPSPSNFVTLATDQEITGTKTLTGAKKLGFKQSSYSDVIGFTAYNNNNYEVGNLQIANRGNNGMYVTLGNYSTQTNKARVGFRLQPNSSTNSFNFVMPYGNYSSFTANGYSTSTDTTIPCSFTDGTTKIKADDTGLVNISSLLPTVPTNVSAFTNDAGYITAASVPTTATSTSTSTVTPSTIQLTFTFEDDTTQTVTLMTSAIVSTTTTTTLS